MILKRSLVGLLVGLMGGSVVVAITSLYDGSGFTIGGLSHVTTTLFIGALIGIPVGVIVSVAAGATEYRTGWGGEWALVGALAAGLTMLFTRTFVLRPALILLALFVPISVLAAWASNRWFRDERYSSTMTGATLMAYGTSVVAITIIYAVLLGLLGGFAE